MISGVGWEMSTQSTEKFEGNENSLCDTILIDKCYYTFAQTHRMHDTKSEP